MSNSTVRDAQAEALTAQLKEAATTESHATTHYLGPALARKTIDLINNAADKRAQRAYKKEKKKEEKEAAASLPEGGAVERG